jgi:hypothetical protein
MNNMLSPSAKQTAMNETITRSSFLTILKRNGYTVEASSLDKLCITKSRIILANLILPLLLPLPFLTVGVFEMFTTNIDTFDFLLLIVIPIGAIISIFRLNFKNLKSRVCISGDGVMITYFNKHKRFDVKDIKGFRTGKHYGQIQLLLKSQQKPVLVFQLMNLNPKYLKDDMGKIVRFLNTKTLNHE